MSEPTSRIHDLGYKRYVGTRRPASTRWRVILRNQIAIAWKRWWRYKLSLFLSIVITFVAGAIMYFIGGRNMKMLIGDGTQLKIVDGVLPAVVQFYCSFPLFILSLTLGSMIIASDTQTGAFTFYYVRPVRARDYVLGKLAGYGLIVGSLIIIPLILLAGFRLAIGLDSVDQLVERLVIFPKVLAIGTLATLLYTTIPLAISSLMAKRSHAIAVWAAYYYIFGNICAAIGLTSTPFVAAFDIQTGLSAVTQQLFNVSRPIQKNGFNLELSGNVAALILIAQVIVAIGVIAYQVSRDQKSGVGASS